MSQITSGKSTETKKTRYIDFSEADEKKQIEIPINTIENQNKLRSKLKKSEDVVGLLEMVEQAVNADAGAIDSKGSKKKDEEIFYK